MNINRKKLSIGLAVLIAIILPVTIFTVMRQQDTRSGASGSAILLLEPTQGNHNIGDQIQVRASINAGTSNVAYVKASIQFDKTKFNFVNFAKSNKFNEFLTNADVVGVNEDTVSFEMINTDQAPNTGIIELGTLTFEATTAGTGTVTFNPIEAYVAGDITPMENPTEATVANYTVSTSTTSDPTTTEFESPQTIANATSGGDASWSNADNVKESDSQFATTSTLYNNDTSRILLAKNFGFNIPASATINGVTIRIERKQNASGQFYKIYDEVVSLTKDGIMAEGINAKSSNNWGITKTDKEYGSATSLWNLTLTPTDVNSQNFGVALSVKNGSTGAISPQVDHIQMKISYTVPSESNATPTPSPSPSPTPTGTLTPSPSPSPSPTPTGTLTPSPSPTGSQTSNLCPEGKPLHSNGNANCDDNIDYADYNIWKRKMQNIAGTENDTRPDFDGQNGVTIGDYQIWSDNFPRN